MANPPIDRQPVLDKINAAFKARSCWYNFKRARRSKRLGQLNDRMNKLNHVEIRQSQQISLEAQWLINYTDDWERADKTLDWFEQSLDQGNVAYEQQPDGSWGVGCTEFYRKLEPTVGALQKLDGRQYKRLDFMQPLQDPQYVRDYLDRLRISRIHQTGRNNRDEFGSLITSLAQLFFKAKVAAALQKHAELDFKVTNASFAGLKDYLWQIQSSETGYWGPTYDFDGEIIEVQDLSYTFHVVKYYNDSGARHDLPNTDKIIPTTRTIENFFYPNGLKPDPESGNPPPAFSDHNNYDLVTMFQQMWKGMTPETQADAQKEIQTLINWCLTTSLQGDTFAPTKGMSMADSYYNAVSFLGVVGFWLRLPFWTTAPIPVPAGTLAPADLADKLLTRFQKDFDDHSDSAHDVIDMLTDAKGGVIHATTLALAPAAQVRARLGLAARTS